MPSFLPPRSSGLPPATSSYGTGAPFTFPSYQEWKTQFQSKMPTWPKANFSEDFWAGAYRDAQRRARMTYDTANPPSSAPLNLNLPDPTKYFDESSIQTLFNTLFGNLSRAKGSAVSSATNVAGAYAGQRGLANPGAFITASGTGAAAPYAQAFGGLEASRGQALTENQRLLWQALMSKSEFEEKAREFDVTNERERQRLQQEYDLGLQALRLRKEQQTAGAFDWIKILLQTAGTVGGALIGGPAGAAVGGAVGSGVGSGFSTNDWRYDPSQFTQPYTWSGK